jgi:outer membrane protein
MTRHLLITTILILVLLSGCYPPGPETTEELDLVFTNYSEDFQFQSAKTNATNSYENLSFTGVQYRYSSQVPFFLSADNSLNPDAETKPYVGMGIGTIYSHRKTDMGVYSYAEEAWQFALKPEVSIIRELSFNTALKVAFKYYSGFKGGDLDTQSYTALSLGFVFM